MKRLALVLLAWFALVPPAGAATYYVRQNATGTGAGTDSSNCMRIATADSTVTGADLMLLLGNFTTTPVPRLSGTSYAAPITIRSLYNTPGAVTINAGLTVDGLAAGGIARADSFVVWRSLTFTGSLDFGHSTNRVGRFRFRNCTVAGGLNFINTYGCRVDSSTFTRTGGTNGQYGVQFVGGSCGDSTNCYPARDTITYTNVTLTNMSGNGISFFLTGRDHYLSHVRFSATTSTAISSGLRFARFAGSRRALVTDCYFYGNNLQSDGGNDEPMGFSFKDGVKLAKMYRDTIIIEGNYKTTSPLISFAQNETDGNPANTGEEIGGNTLRNCYIANRTGSDWPINWTYDGFDGDSIVGNTFVAAGGPVQAFYNRGDAVMGTNTIVDHNLFATFSHGASAFSIGNGVNNSTDQGVVFTNNIFYQPTATDADTSAARAASMGNASIWTADTYGPISSDYNLGYAPGTHTRRTVGWSGGADWYGRTGAGTWSVANGTAQDLHSIWGPTIFQDSTLASFDAHPLTGSAALFGPDGYVGPFALAGGASTWTVTASAGTHGSVTPSGSLTVADGGTQQLNMAPDVGYYVASITVDGVTSSDDNDWQQNQYSFVNVTANHSFSCTFTAITSQIAVSAGAHGSIAPTTAAYAYGANQTFTITPDANYSVLDVTVDGVPQGTITSYAFSNIIAEHTISATFALIANNWTISASSVGSGTLSPTGGVSVADGGSQAFSWQPNSGWYVATVLVDGVSVSTTSPYTFSNVTAAHTIVVTFGTNEAIVVSSAGDNGTIYPSGSVFVAGGAQASYSIVPDPFHAIEDVEVDGVSVGPVAWYTFTNVITSHTIEATFTSEERHGGSNWRRRWR